WCSLSFCRRRNLGIGPGKVLVIDHEFPRPGLHVIKDRDTRRADDSQLLFLKRIKTVYKHVRANSTGEAHGGESGIRHVVVQVTSAGAADLLRKLVARQGKDDGDIMGGKTPKRVFLTTNFAHVQAVGDNVMELAQIPSQQTLSQSQHAGMILE